MRTQKQMTSPDPLFVIFEQHLVHFEDPNLDRATFIEKVIQDYFSYLRRRHITIPRALEKAISEELSTQLRLMLLKKIYGFLTLQDYQKDIAPQTKKKIKARYTKLLKKTV